MNAGRLLVATPLLSESPFRRTVVLLLQAGGDDGALGVVLNRPTEAPVRDVLPGWDGLAADPAVVFEGGPVQPEAAICLGRCTPGDGLRPWLAPLELGLGPRLATVDLEASPDEVAPSLERVRIFAGYAGWTAGQLEGEIEEGAWWLVEALPGDPFTGRPDVLWRQVLRRQGPPLAFAATFPDNPALN